MVAQDNEGEDLTAVYCTFNGHFFLDFSIENAEIMENCI